MEKVNFDDYLEDYDQLLNCNLKHHAGFFDEDSRYFAEHKIRIVKEMTNFEPKRILEYGCGIGKNIEYLLKYFADTEVYGMDIARKCLEHAALKYPFAKFGLCDEFNGAQKFDIIIASGVFHHINPEQREATVKKISALLADRGLVYIFEHNPYNPITRRLVNQCPYDADAKLLKMAETIHLFAHNGFEVDKKQYIIFFPKIFNFLRPLESKICFVPLGGQYFVRARKIANRV